MTCAKGRFVTTQAELAGKGRVLFGGRIAEQVVFGDRSTGLEDDLVKATEIARTKIRSYGMSDRPGTSASRGKAEDRSRYTVAARCARLPRRDRVGDRRGGLGAARRPGEEGGGDPGIKRNTFAAAAEQLLFHETLSGDELRPILTGAVYSVAA